MRSLHGPDFFLHVQVIHCVFSGCHEREFGLWHLPFFHCYRSFVTEISDADTKYSVSFSTDVAWVYPPKEIVPVVLHNARQPVLPWLAVLRSNGPNSADNK